jgi:hypothetical protein
VDRWSCSRCWHRLAKRETQMKDWAVSFIAAVLFCGLVVWCAKVFVEVLYAS